MPFQRPLELHWNYTGTGAAGARLERDWSETGTLEPNWSLEPDWNGTGAALELVCRSGLARSLTDASKIRARRDALAGTFLTTARCAGSFAIAELAGVCGHR